MLLEEFCWKWFDFVEWAWISFSAYIFLNFQWFIFTYKKSGFGTFHYWGCQRIIEPVSNLFFINQLNLALFMQNLNWTTAKIQIIIKIQNPNSYFLKNICLLGFLEPLIIQEKRKLYDAGPIYLTENSLIPMPGLTAIWL